MTLGIQEALPKAYNACDFWISQLFIVVPFGRQDLRDPHLPPGAIYGIVHPACGTIHHEGMASSKTAAMAVGALETFQIRPLVNKNTCSTSVGGCKIHYRPHAYPMNVPRECCSVVDLSVDQSLNSDATCVREYMVLFMYISFIAGIIII